MNQKNTLAMRFFYSNDPRTTQIQHTDRRSAAGSPEILLYSNANAVLKLTTIVSNTLVNEARGSFQRLFTTPRTIFPAGGPPEPRHHADQFPARLRDRLFPS